MCLSLKTKQDKIFLFSTNVQEQSCATDMRSCSLASHFSERVDVKFLLFCCPRLVWATVGYKAALQSLAESISIRNTVQLSPSHFLEGALEAPRCLQEAP